MKKTIEVPAWWVWTIATLTTLNALVALTIIIRSV
jgi:hypothetical protein